MSVNSAKSEDPLENLIIKYKNHPSIRAILDKSPNKSFSLKAISKINIEKEILNLNVAKVSQDSDIPTKIIKKNSDIKSLEICKFPSCLNMANFTPVYKKGNRSDKDYYRPVSILPNLSKGVYVNKFLHFLRISFLSINAGSGKNIMLNTAH